MWGPERCLGQYSIIKRSLYTKKVSSSCALKRNQPGHMSLPTSGITISVFIAKGNAISFGLRKQDAVISNWSVQILTLDMGSQESKPWEEKPAAWKRSFKMGKRYRVSTGHRNLIKFCLSPERLEKLLDLQNKSNFYKKRDN